jgi:hypothetical protein
MVARRLAPGRLLQILRLRLGRRIIRFHETKNGEPRIVPLPSVLVNMLRGVEPKVGRVFDDEPAQGMGGGLCGVRTWP